MGIAIGMVGRKVIGATVSVVYSTNYLHHYFSIANDTTSAVLPMMPGDGKWYRGFNSLFLWIRPCIHEPIFTLGQTLTVISFHFKTRLGALNRNP